MFFALSSPISLTAIILYLFLSLFGNDFRIWLLALTFSSIILLFHLKNNFQIIFNIRKLISFKNLSLIFLILFFVFCKAFVISPFVLTKTTDSFRHIQITDVGDYYKHSFVVTMLKLDGIPPSHPYFPVAKLSYYFGYYLIPASFSKLFNIAPNLSFYVFSIVTDILGLLIILRIFHNFLKTYIGKLLAVLLLITGVGVNIFPEIFSKFPFPGYLINPEIFATDIGFQLINNYKAILFVPQHFFAACLSIGLIHNLIFEKKNIFFVSITTAFIFLSSLFVSWVFILWLFLVFVFYKENRIFLIICGVFTIALLFPYLIQLTNRTNLFYLNHFQPFKFIPSENILVYLTNTFLTAILQYGLILTILPFLIISKGKIFLKSNLLLILGFSLPIIITWIIRSPIYNDFSLRGLMPLQLILPLFFMKLYEQLKQKFLKIFLFALILFVITISFLGFYLEYLRHWKSRMILHPSISQLIFEIRKIPDDIKLSAIDRDRWVEFIPSLGFKKVLSPFLFDSYVYFVGDKTLEHGQYERQAIDLFLEPTQADNLENLVKIKNTQLENLNDFFKKYPTDKLILNNKLWVKKDINPFLVFFREVGIKLSPLTSDFTLVDYQSLVEITSKLQMVIQSDKKMNLTINNKQFPLEKGLWFISSCGEFTNIHLELEDYYQLFNRSVNKGSCVGRIFYLQQDEDLMLTNNSNINEVFIFPIEIRQIN